MRTIQVIIALLQATREVVDAQMMLPRLSDYVDFSTDVSEQSEAGDRCMDKLQEVCGAAKQKGEATCSNCISQNAARLAFFCMSHRSEEQAFCKAQSPQCDTEMKNLCGSVMGTGTACDDCIGDHQMELKRARCADAELTGFCTPGINPLYKTNVTVYHVNPSTYGSTPINMNTGNAAGDMFFWAKSVATPIECAANSTRAGMSGFDCKNAEVTSSNLAVTKLVLEIDNRFTGYSMCNICVDGRDPLSHRSGHNCSMVPLPQYVCDCSSHSYPGHGPVGGGCNASVGMEDVKQFFGRFKPRSRGSQDETMWWLYNTVMKLGGQWYSTLPEGMCTEPPKKYCTWRVAQVSKMVDKSCQDDSIYAMVESQPSGKDCFAACNATDGGVRNTTSPCWIRCFYDVVLGQGSGSTDLSKDPTAGLSQEALLAAWDRPFTTNDRTIGGCPPKVN